MRFGESTTLQANVSRVGILLRLRQILRLTAESWDTHRHLRGGLAFALMICTAVSGAKWYSWAEHQGIALYVPILWTIGAVLIFALAPKKLDLLAYCSAIYFILGIIGTLLGRAPDLRTALEVTVIPGIALAIFSALTMPKRK